MSGIFNLTTKTGDIVTCLPDASSILKQYRIDFCCGGNRPIGDAIAEKNLNGDEILEKLHQLYLKSLEKPPFNWDEVSSTELIHHIIHDYHENLEIVLPELSQFTTKILRVHGKDCSELSSVHGLFHLLKAELEQHTADEENEVFPLIEAFEKNPTEEVRAKLLEKIEIMTDDHEGAGEILYKLRTVTKDYTVPEWACMTFKLTYQKLEKLESDLFEHIHLENNILFPRVIKSLKEIR